VIIKGGGDMRSFKEYMESMEADMTGSNIVMICNKLRENGSNPSDTGYLVVADILEGLGNDLKADTMRMALSSVYAEKAAKIIAESGSKGFVSLDGVLIRSSRSIRQRPYTELTMEVDKVKAVKDIVERSYSINDGVELTAMFNFSDSVVDGAREKHMGVQQYMIGKRLNSSTFDFMHPPWGRMMRMMDADGHILRTALYHNGEDVRAEEDYRTIREAFRDNCGTDAIIVDRYERSNSYRVESDIESYAYLRFTHENISKGGDNVQRFIPHVWDLNTDEIYWA
jgi:hypothetical protein